MAACQGQQARSRRSSTDRKEAEERSRRGCAGDTGREQDHSDQGLMRAAVSELARAKVNLELEVVGRRADGYHLLDSIVAFADIADRLSFEEAPRFELVLTGPFARQAPLGEDNLVARAAHALFRAHRRPLLPVRVTLEKNIPLASGLGGGS